MYSALAEACRESIATEREMVKSCWMHTAASNVRIVGIIQQLKEVEDRKNVDFKEEVAQNGNGFDKKHYPDFL